MPVPTGCTAGRVAGPVAAAAAAQAAGMMAVEEAVRAFAAEAVMAWNRTDGTTEGVSCHRRRYYR